MGAGYAAVAGTNRKYGYGLMAGPVRGVKLLEHGGARSGYGSVIRMAPEQKVAVIILVNKSSGSLPKTLDAASELLLPFEKKAEPAKPDAKEFTEDEAKRLTGRYTNNRGSVNVFRTDDGKLEVKGLQASGFYTRASGWTFTGGGRSVTFVPGKDGVAEFICIGSRAMARVSAP
jgi:CubicO group peptidase (beta-lactamase class C family)